MADAQKPADMVTLTIDGATVTVPKGTTILNAAEQLGTRVPHYCYHGGLTSPAMCRLCLVEVVGAPKLQPSCVTTVAEGQVVLTESAKAKQMRTGVLEFYLVNHPLDCPICDQSGECKLQDYVSAEGRKHGRSREPKRVFGRDDFGGDVLFYGDRCVMCTRCVRFMNEIEQDPRLTVVDRGDRAVIDTFFAEGLENTYFSGNVVDICPVGALVSKDFLYKQRAWDLDHTPSVCPNCSQGCNIELHTRDNLVQRLKPRLNPDVNSYWMCDYGRLTYEWINRGDRVEVPLLRRPATKAVGWGEAIGNLTEQLKAVAGAKVTAVASPFSSNEDLAALSALVEQLGGGEIVYRSKRAQDEVPLKGFPTLTRRRDLSPNAKTAELFGAKRVGNDDGTGGLADLIHDGGVVLVVGDDLADQAETFGQGAALYVYFGTHGSKAAANAHVVLPLTTFAETDGTFTNVQGRVQRFFQGIEPPGAARPAWLVLGHLLAALGGGSAPTTPEDAFRTLAGRRSEFEGIGYTDIGMRGALLNEPARLSATSAATAGD
jgi:NADH-quinone oxidoreductase subunit G